MLDRQLIRFGGSYDKIEVCDIYKAREPGGRGEFVHVKRGRGSSTLSHLLAQGLVASSLMVREREFVKDVNIQLIKQGIAAVPESFEDKGNDVVYAIIDGPVNVELDIPFFSKVTLQKCGKTISSYGYDVKLMHIPESAAYLAIVAQKEAVKAAKKKAEKSVGKNGIDKNTARKRASTRQDDSAATAV
ncbi:TIGR04141 family sporadically distributed protein [Pseudomonas rossensis]|uniref:TIGR04141 family sporadically distributed protein n=1 Tax=Pseudomonas rossensis TaxID=2305471 RepID=UPI00326169F6